MPTLCSLLSTRYSVALSLQSLVKDTRDEGGADNYSMLINYYHFREQISEYAVAKRDMYQELWNYYKYYE